MVYETEIPPVPNRQQELEMISKLKQSFQAQPYYKFYMNEGVRTAKMEHAEKMNKYRIGWWMNFARGALFSTLLLTPVALMYRRTATGVPLYFMPKHFLTAAGLRGPHDFRNLKMLRFIFPMVILCSYGYASLRTSMEPIFDERYDDKAVKLPY